MCKLSWYITIFSALNVFFHNTSLAILSIIHYLFSAFTIWTISKISSHYLSSIHTLFLNVFTVYNTYIFTTCPQRLFPERIFTESLHYNLEHTNRDKFSVCILREKLKWRTELLSPCLLLFLCLFCIFVWTAALFCQCVYIYMVIYSYIYVCI